MMPRICGMVPRKPNVAPDAASITLFGPGVKAATAAKRAKAAVEAASMLCDRLVG